MYFWFKICLLIPKSRTSTNLTGKYFVVYVVWVCACVCVCLFSSSSNKTMRFKVNCEFSSHFIFKFLIGFPIHIIFEVISMEKLSHQSDDWLLKKLFEACVPPESDPTSNALSRHWSIGTLVVWRSSWNKICSDLTRHGRHIRWQGNRMGPDRCI